MKITQTLCLLAMASLAGAVPPARLNYQGVLHESGILVNGQRTLSFRFYNAPTGGTLLWDSGASDVDVNNGLFSTVLTGGNPVLSTATFQSGSIYLEVIVNGTVMTPREMLASAAFAMQAGSVDGGVVRVLNAASGPTGLNPGALYYDTGTEQLYYTNNSGSWAALAAGGVSPWTRSGGNVALTVSNDKVGIGSAVPDQKFSVTGNISLTGVLIASGTGSNYIAGTLGLGTSSPIAQLEVAGGSIRALSQAVPVVPGAGKGVELYYDGGSDQGRILSTDRSSTHRPLLMDGSAVLLNSISGGQVGIGTNTPGALLGVAGSVKIADGTQGSGKVLTSDSAGLASWQSPAAGPWSQSGSNVSLTTSTDRVGMGTASPDQKLSVAGSVSMTGVLVASGTGTNYFAGAVKIADGTQGSGKVLTSDSAGLASWQDTGIPTGAIMFFDLTSCPNGWSEFTAARGRYLTGRPLGASTGTVVGTALSDAENRAVGQHTHIITDPGHTHSFAQSVLALTTVVGAVNIYASGGSTSSGSSTTGVTINNSGSVAGTNAPYIQLLICHKD